MVRALTRQCRRRLRALARFAAAREAATAVEFALIAPAFIALVVAIFQVAVYIFVQQSLQNAATSAGRLFLTGQAQTWSQTAFKNYVCTNYLPTMFNCNSLVVSVQPYTSFAAATAANGTSAPALYDGSGNPITSFPYSTGSQGTIMIVQLVYPWSVVSGPLGFTISNLPNSAKEMMGVAAFKVEPY
jgi:Flp pilus assembly protein TadG